MMFSYNGKAYSAWVHCESVNGGKNNLAVAEIFESFGPRGSIPVAIGISKKGNEQAVKNARANLRRGLRKTATSSEEERTSNMTKTKHRYDAM